VIFPKLSVRHSDYHLGELFETVILHGCQVLDICDALAKRGDGKHKIPFVAYLWSWDSDLKSLAAGRGLGEAAWRITCAAVLYVEPAAKSVTADQMQMVLAGVTRLNEAMFWVQDSVKEGRAAAAVAKLRFDVQEKLQMLIGQSDVVVEKLVGKSIRRSIDDSAAASASALEAVKSAAASPPAPPPPTTPQQPFNTGFIACTMLVLLQAWKKQESARQPSAADIFANLSLASRKCLIYGCKDQLLDSSGTEIFGVASEGGAVVPPNATPLPDPHSLNWREWAVVLQHPLLLDSLTNGSLGRASMTWMLSQVLTINTIKNDAQWLPEGFATSGYVFADFSGRGSPAAEQDASVAPQHAVDDGFFLVSRADTDAADAAASAASSAIVVAAACERDLTYADALGAGFRTILLAGKSTVDSAVAACAPLPLPLHMEAAILRGRRTGGDFVRMALGMEEGPGRRRRKLKLVTRCGDYVNAREARDAPVGDAGRPLTGNTLSAEVPRADDGAAAAAEQDDFSSLNPLASSLVKRRPSLSM
jgi:hypothetical protein